MGQPLETGLAQLGDKIPKGKTVWMNMREEPILYINGVPCAPRHKTKLHENIVVSLKPEELNAFEDKCVTEVEAMKKDGSMEVHKDAAHQENPMEREDMVENVKADNIKSFHSLVKGLTESMPELTYVRIPFQEERALPEACFDLMVKQLAGESPANTTCVITSQKGQGRSTLAAVAASIIKATQMMVKLNTMVAEGMAERSWADGIIRSKFEDPLPSEDNKDPFLRGEFDVIKELLEKVPETKTGKVLADKMIDICGVPPEGTGIQNLRKCIIQTKYKYDAATEDRQAVWKKMIINFIERYFYLICFATYAKQFGPEGFKKTFVEWINENSSLRDMIANGKDKLEWSRKVDQGAVDEIHALINGENVKEKLGEVVTKLYKISHSTYADMPRGTIKDTLMRKLTCKTLMDILPADILAKVKKELEEKKLSSDFETVVGLVVAV